MQTLQDQIHEWRQHNFPTESLSILVASGRQLLGVVEEVGELSHAHLKQEQGIRGTVEEHEASARDAVGDILIFLHGYCSYRGWDIEAILEATAEEVLERDWIKYPHDGKTK